MPPETVADAILPDPDASRPDPSAAAVSPVETPLQNARRMEPTRPIKGRGASSRMAGRFDQRSTESVDDGWMQLPDDTDPDPQRPPTEVRFEDARSIISRNRSPDVGFEQSINPYRGCEHGCVYCFARPTH